MESYTGRVRGAKLVIVVTFLALVLPTSVSAALSIDQRWFLFAGEFDGVRIHLLVSVSQATAVGAVVRFERDYPWDRPLEGVHLLVGSYSSGTKELILSERDAHREVGQFRLRTSSSAAIGTWSADSGKRQVKVALKPIDESTSPLTNTTLTTRPIVDALYVAVRKARWSEAIVHAQLLRVLPHVEPDWVPALQAFASGKSPTPVPHASWVGFELERQGRIKEAVVSYRESCRYSRSGCLFLLDLADRMSKQERTETFRANCSAECLGCAKYWGQDSVDLVQAARTGDTRRVEELLRRGANVNAGEGCLFTPLQAAVLADSLPVVNVLLEHGADPNNPRQAKGWGIHMPLEAAVVNSKYDIAMTLLDHGARANNGGGVLFEAVYKRRRDIALKILANGEDPDGDPVPAGTPLSAAVDNGDVEMVKALLAHGARPDFATKFSHGSPLDHARRMKRGIILKMLLEAKKLQRRESQ